MNREERMERVRERQEASEGTYQAEHWLAWVMAATALVLGLLGILRAFGVIGDVAEQAQIEGAVPGGIPLGQGSFWDGMVWLVPGIAAGLLAMALHMNDHHRAHGAAEGTEGGLYKLEHGLAWLMALATIVAGALCLLVGFDLFGQDHTQFDGIIWGFAAILYGTLTVTLHAVRGHQMAADEDYLVTLVERRVRSGGTYGTTPGSIPETERR